MAEPHPYTVTALFDSRSDADAAVSRLRAAGFSDDDVRLLPGHERDPGGGEPPARSALADGGAGFWYGLTELFLPDRDRSLYAEGLRRGGFLVSVRTGESDHDRAVEILEEAGTIDLDEREAAWRAQGWREEPEREVFQVPAPDASAEIASDAIGAAQNTASGLSYGVGFDAPDADDAPENVAARRPAVRRDLGASRRRVRSFAGRQER
jgi:hypothetical protein